MSLYIRDGLSKVLTSWREDPHEGFNLSYLQSDDLKQPSEHSEDLDKHVQDVDIEIDQSQEDMSVSQTSPGCCVFACHALFLVLGLLVASQHARFHMQLLTRSTWVVCVQPDSSREERPPEQDMLYGYSKSGIAKMLHLDPAPSSTTSTPRR
eukprot:2027739-Rhodomonas_salina.2